MSAFSYFWNSQEYLSTATFWIELAGAAVELIISGIVVATFHKDWDEHVKNRLEFLFEVGFLIAALIACVAILSNRRIETLTDQDSKESAKILRGTRSDLTNALDQVASLSNEVLAQSNALAAANIKTLKQRLRDLLNRIDPKILNVMDSGNGMGQRG